MEINEDIRINSSHQPLSLQRQTYIKAKHGLKRKFGTYRNALRYHYTNYVGQYATIAPLLAQVSIVRLTKDIYEIKPNKPREDTLLATPYTLATFEEVYPTGNYDEYLLHGSPPMEWATGDTFRVGDDIDWTFFETIANWGDNLDNHIVIVMSIRGVCIGLGGLRHLYIPEQEYCGEYLPYIRSLLDELTLGSVVDTLGLSHVLAACVWYVSRVKMNDDRAKLFGLPTLVGGKGNLYIGDWINVRTTQIPNNQTHLKTHLPYNAVQAISFNRTQAMTEYLAVQNTMTGQQKAQHAYGIIEQVKKDDKKA